MKIHKPPRKKQFFYFLLIFLSGGTLFYIKTLPDNRQSFPLMFVLLIVMMYSLMKATKNWAYDNPKKNEKKRNQYKNVNIPSLEEMIKKSKTHKTNNISNSEIKTKTSQGLNMEDISQKQNITKL